MIRSECAFYPRSRSCDPKLYLIGRIKTRQWSTGTFDLSESHKKRICPVSVQRLSLIVYQALSRSVHYSTLVCLGNGPK